MAITMNAYHSVDWKSEVNVSPAQHEKYVVGRTVEDGSRFLLTTYPELGVCVVRMVNGKTTTLERGEESKKFDLPVAIENGNQHVLSRNKDNGCKVRQIDGVETMDVASEGTTAFEQYTKNAGFGGLLNCLTSGLKQALLRR